MILIEFCCSPVYHFPNELSSEYTVAAVVLEKPPMRKFYCQSEFSAGVDDYIMDRTPDPIEGQSYCFTQGEQRSTPKTTGKRKRAAPSKITLEERLIEQELSYNE